MQFNFPIILSENKRFGDFTVYLWRQANRQAKKLLQLTCVFFNKFLYERPTNNLLKNKH